MQRKELKFSSSGSSRRGESWWGGRFPNLHRVQEFLASSRLCWPCFSEASTQDLLGNTTPHPVLPGKKRGASHGQLLLGWRKNVMVWGGQCGVYPCHTCAHTDFPGFMSSFQKIWQKLNT